MRPTTVAINSLGMRGDELVPSGRPRLLVLGDSAWFGAGVDQEETAAAQLEVLLREPPVRVLNGSIPGSNSSQGVYLLRHRYGKLRPAWLILCYNNDSVAGPPQRVPGVNGPEAGLPLSTLEILYRSRLYLTVRRTLLPFRPLLRLPGEPPPPRPGPGFPAPPEAAGGTPQRAVPLDQVVRNLESFHEWTRENGAELLVLLSIYRPGSDGAPPAEALSPSYRQIIRKAAGRLGFHLLDLQEEGEGQLHAGMFLPGDPIHPNARGQRWMARRVAAYLAPRLRGGEGGSGSP